MQLGCKSDLVAFLEVYMQEALLEALIDSIKLIPFLFVTYLAMGMLERAGSGRAQEMIRSAGHVGPVIGGLIGGASIVLFGQLDMISALSGVVLAFCTLKGYELLGKDLSLFGIIVSIAIMLAVPYLADRVNWALVFVEELGFGFGDAFRYVHEAVEEFGLEADYWKDLLLIYGFAALGAFTIVKQPLKKKI
jgi:hypothetical protein